MSSSYFVQLQKALMPNIVAFAALALWPFVSLSIFLNLNARRAVIWSILAAWLLLPVSTSFDFPGLPSLNKATIPNLCALIFALALTRYRLFKLPKSLFLKLALFTFVISPFFTTLGNPDPIVLATQTIPQMTFYDALASCFVQASAVIPFLLGYQLLGDEDGHHEILKALMIAIVVYSIPMLLEIRLSPQLHSMLYGFFPHSFGQQVREGGFRPVVFLGHGLIVAIFCAMGFVGTLYMALKGAKLWGIKASLLVVYIFVLLLLCKSLGAALLAAAAGAVALLCRPRKMLMLSSIISLILLSYPAVRGVDLFPVESLTSIAGSFSDERAESLKFRFDNENKLLKKAAERPLFGWGIWGRNRVYEGYNDSDSSVTDGTWVIIAGMFGWVGYLACFGLLCYPLADFLFDRRRRLSPSLATGCLSLVLLINLIDLIPNSSLTPLTWLIAGALSARHFGKSTKGHVNPKGPATAEALTV